ncbi:MAG: hypothetical protein L0H20_12530 [Corynebacterium sp.]|uniref:hypothetical protein n=1 Tax=Corynebacterium sp. TaxID=1720 RepID=UPI002647C76E|nr:hypothetical protein [Corynebacterium sp.]MDN5723802.1 hypothetical protein [Corynebacterium sp.]
MRSIYRFNVVAAATALAAGTILASAGMAGAAPVEPEMSSPSVLSYSGTGEDLEVTYKNRSGYRLTCIAYVGERDLIEDIEEWALGMDAVDPVEVPDGLWAAMEAAGAAGQLGVHQSWIDDGDDVVLPAAETLSKWGGGPTIAVGFTDHSFNPTVNVQCADYVDGVVTYREFKTVPTDLETLGSVDLGSVGSGSSDLESLGAGSLDPGSLGS